MKAIISKVAVNGEGTRAGGEFVAQICYLQCWWGKKASKETVFEGRKKGTSEQRPGMSGRSWMAGTQCGEKAEVREVGTGRVLSAPG